MKLVDGILDGEDEKTDISSSINWRIIPEIIRYDELPLMQKVCRT
jgi:hypothetical protein